MLFMLFNGFLHTGTRCFDESAVRSIDLWKTDGQAQIALGEDGEKILLDEDESRIVRDWASASLQAAIVYSQGHLISMRCGLREETLRAEKLNRASTRSKSRKRAVTKRLPAQVSKDTRLVDIGAWKASAQETPAIVEECPQIAA